MKYLFLASGIYFGVIVAAGNASKLALILAGSYIIIGSLGSFSRATIQENK